MHAELSCYVFVVDGYNKSLMNITVIKRNDQADGQFNGGAILEKRPVFYQQDNTFPYSNLFYWAHAWSKEGSTIGLHPHQGFEILSFVLKGEIEHYDTKNKTWLKLKTGDVQIIRAGNGISHAEKLMPGSAIFQIWFDPDLEKSMRTPATYNDYFSNTFPVLKENGVTTTVFKGDEAPVRMEAEGVSIRQMKMAAGVHELRLTSNSIYSMFILEGSASIDGHQLGQHDFAKIENTDSITIETESCSVFVIETPAQPSYMTYVDRHHERNH